MIRKYPIDLPSFSKIRNDGYIYVDKTRYIHQLVETGKYYFLSRPSGFGKSLLVDTIAELFSGSKELFEGLWIHDHWDWEKTSPVIRFSMAQLAYDKMSLAEALKSALNRNADRLGIKLLGVNLKDLFIELIEKASVKGNVVILIDEYDKPIIDYVDDPETMDENRFTMKSFYSILKDSDNYIRLLFMTGVSQFSQLSIFSDLNNLRNITLVSQYGGLTGITGEELEHYFAPEIAERQKEDPEILDKIKAWYDGYTWNLKDWVYNPNSILNYFADPDLTFTNFWFNTATPTYLVNHLKRYHIHDLEEIKIGANDMYYFDPRNTPIGSILFQTGYLTLKHRSPSGQVYTLGFPNKEVKISFLDNLLGIYRGVYPSSSIQIIENIQDALNAKDIDGLIAELNALIASIPFDHWKADKESIFNIIIFLTFRLAGLEVGTEIHNSKGRCDLLIKTDQYIYVIELKLDGTTEQAIDQIIEKEYLAQYETDTRQKIAIGVNCSSKQKNITEHSVREL